MMKFIWTSGPMSSLTVGRMQFDYYTTYLYVRLYKMGVINILLYRMHPTCCNYATLEKSTVKDIGTTHRNRHVSSPIGRKIFRRPKQ